MLLGFGKYEVGWEGIDPVFGSVSLQRYKNFDCVTTPIRP
jgi:hypothetical protein